MKIKIFTVNPFQMNSYLYFCEKSLEGVIIDPGYYTKYEEDILLKYISDNGIFIKCILCTHGHIDHILGNGFAKDKFNVDTFLHEDDLFLYESANIQGEYYGLQLQSLPKIDNFIRKETKIRIGNNVLDFIHTPGHSPGGVCITDHAEKKVFCGDVIFQSSIGRTDLPGGDFSTLIDSIKSKLFNLCDDNYYLYPGHMNSTTIGEERKNNPYLQ